jgi:LmbE family N-acetylglucosaminyl deacetylase
MKIDFGKCLILSPHADDWLLGCFSIVHRYSPHIVVFKASGPSTRSDQVEEELSKTRDLLKITVTEPSYDGLDEVTDHIYHTVNDFDIDTVFLPAGPHRDHIMVRNAALDATMNHSCSIMYYWGNIRDINFACNHDNLLPTGRIRLTPEEFRAKNEIMRDIWASQANRLSYMQLDEWERFRIGRWET